MQLLIDYMRNDELRHMLNEMTEETFGFSFETWYCAGCFEGEYIPFSFADDGKILANASANIMRMSVYGENKRFIQIGTVLTRPQYRNRGLARKLIQEILRVYESKADGFYLFGNLNALGFYEKLGFEHMAEYRWYLKNRVSGSSLKAPFVRAGKGLMEHYRYVLAHAQINAVLDQINRRSLQLFYTLDMEDVYYCEELDCFAVMNINEDTLYLDSIVSTKRLSMTDVLERIDGEYANAVLGFTPNEDDQKLFEKERYEGGDDYRLFCMGEQLSCISNEKLFFPVMSHA